MPRFHFNVLDGTNLVDTEGHECKSVADAQRLAVKLAGDLIRDAGARLWHDGAWEMEVTDANRLTLFRFIFMIVQAPAMASAT